MDAVPPLIRQAFRDLLAESATLPPALTPRRVFGPVWMPAKATAVIGMRRVGKTTFVHQLREQRRAQGVSAQRLPFRRTRWTPASSPCSTVPVAPTLAMRWRPPC